ncbi:unnamed protein product [Lupinus luteus]|uniref:Uncharacterized protein n=1 Tax=Lupinus luteus TaxID=3873 RepID=A0AAV1Y8V4_LUPLU
MEKQRPFAGIEFHRQWRLCDFEVGEMDGKSNKYKTLFGYLIENVDYVWDAAREGIIAYLANIGYPVTSE